jgi:hypothetical protein
MHADGKFVMTRLSDVAPRYLVLGPLERIVDGLGDGKEMSTRRIS